MKLLRAILLTFLQSLITLSSDSPHYFYIYTNSSLDVKHRDAPGIEATVQNGASLMVTCKDASRSRQMVRIKWYIEGTAFGGINYPNFKGSSYIIVSADRSLNNKTIKCKDDSGNVEQVRVKVEIPPEIVDIQIFGHEMSARFISEPPPSEYDIKWYIEDYEISPPDRGDQSLFIALNTVQVEPLNQTKYPEYLARARFYQVPHEGKVRLEIGNPLGDTFRVIPVPEDWNITEHFAEDPILAAFDDFSRELSRVGRTAGPPSRKSADTSPSLDKNELFIPFMGIICAILVFSFGMVITVLYVARYKKQLNTISRSRGGDGEDPSITQITVPPDRNHGKGDLFLRIIKIKRLINQKQNDPYLRDRPLTRTVTHENRGYSRDIEGNDQVGYGDGIRGEIVEDIEGESEDAIDGGLSDDYEDEDEYGCEEGEGEAKHLNGTSTGVFSTVDLTGSRSLEALSRLELEVPQGGESFENTVHLLFINEAFEGDKKQESHETI